MLSHQTRIRVRYAETDQMGVAYYANYLVWMEVGRAELCRAVGARYRDVELEGNVLLAVVEANCRYRSPARYDDEIVIQASIATSSSRGVTFEYEMWEAESGRKIAAGHTKHIFLTPDLKPAHLPERFWPLFGVSPRL
jgi:acyl-CoA thioester hydrolase